MKRFLTLALIAYAILYTMSACGCDDGRDIDLVFVNGSNTMIAAVSVGTEVKGEAAQKADGSSLKRGDSFGFEAGEYPVTVVVYAGSANGANQEELARLCVDEAPTAGERWYVIARDGENGITLAVDTRWPDGV